MEDSGDGEIEKLKLRRLGEMLHESRLRERIVIPAEDGGGLNARLSRHFGRAPYFIVVDLENGEISSIQTVPNESEHFGGFGLPVDRILQLKPNAVITYGMGPKALGIFQEAGVAVLMANADTVREVVEAYRQNRLEELTEGCRYSRHR
jgi:predicted Fe-Mo cluster-binding NifX family protein